MNQLRTFLMAAAVATMASAPVAAAPANPAASLSIAKATRASAPHGRANALGGENGGLFIALGVGVAIIVAIIIVGSEGSKYPTSP